MKISVKRKVNKSCFCDVEIGDVFLYDDKYYMKIQNTCGRNCVCLSDGLTCCLFNERCVEKVESELIIT